MVGLRAFGQKTATNRAGNSVAGGPLFGMVQKGDSHLLPERPEGCFAQKVAVTFLNLPAFFVLLC
jgi:hypothetical protein